MVWVLIDLEIQDLLKKVKGLDAWVQNALKGELTEAKMDLIFYAVGLADGMIKVLEKMGVKVAQPSERRRRT